MTASPINISDEFRCIFIHIPKAAGTSVKEALHLPGQGHPPWNYFAKNFPDKWRRYHKFTIIRNPWDRVVSAYCYAKMKESYWHNEKIGLHPDHEILKNKTFTECCKILLHERELLQHESWHPQYLWITAAHAGKPALAVNSVLRCESLCVDFQCLCRTLGLDNVKLPHKNKSNRIAFRKYFSPKTRKMIARVYRKDIALFNYQY